MSTIELEFVESKAKTESAEAKPARRTRRTKEEIKKEAEASRTTVKDNIVTLNGYFKLELGNYKMLKRNIEKGQNTMLLGPTGVGKTELAWNMAKVLGLPIHIIDMGTMVDPVLGLVGTHTIKVRDGHSYSEFIPSRFSELIQKPGIIVLDELPRASVAANNLLFPCLDFRRELSMEYAFNNSEPIKVHPECVFLATANVGSQYTGSHKMDKALIDRFDIIQVDPPAKPELVNIIKNHAGLPDSDITTIVNCFSSINKAHDEFTIGFSLSVRHLKIIASKVKDGFTIYDAFYSTCKGVGGPEGMKGVEAILGETKK